MLLSASRCVLLVAVATAIMAESTEVPWLPYGCAFDNAMYSRGISSRSCYYRHGMHDFYYMFVFCCCGSNCCECTRLVAVL
ncbi:hypothetical protein V5799_020789 [Amblyomma americanum]|uniref:Secreted protein n=1 Tax=Amblyomma americanum TaxID=6943 RepID=A0AAQ4ETA2_AMBAM